MAEAPSFATKLREYRKERGLSQKQVADMLGTTQTSINRWENNRRRPRDFEQHAIAEKLGVSPVWLMGLESAAPKTAPGHVRIQLDHVVSVNQAARIFAILNE